MGVAKRVCGGEEVVLLGFVASETLAERLQAAFNGLGVAFECGFTPAMIAFVVADFDKEPARKDTEILDAFYSRHGWKERMGG